MGLPGGVFTAGNSCEVELKRALLKTDGLIPCLRSCCQRLARSDVCGHK